MCKLGTLCTLWTLWTLFTFSTCTREMCQTLSALHKHETFTNQGPGNQGLEVFSIRIAVIIFEFVFSLFSWSCYSLQSLKWKDPSNENFVGDKKKIGCQVMLLSRFEHDDGADWIISGRCKWVFLFSYNILNKVFSVFVDHDDDVG